MLNGCRICVVMPAYNAAATLSDTVREIPRDIIDAVILVDDASGDDTVRLAKELGIPTFVHEKNKGYGGNQKTCYAEALKTGADIVIMLHPDYQYTPKLLIAMASMLAYGVYDVVIASRILGQGARRGGMPLYKYVSNRFITFVENILVDRKHTEYHTGYRAYSRKVLETIPFGKNSDDFIFDNQFLVQAIGFGFSIGEISCPTKYFKEASSIGPWAALRYGIGCLYVSSRYFLHRTGIKKYDIMVR
jgi:glycosyltransferase involved in cell wall biosynthesis